MSEFIQSEEEGLFLVYRTSGTEPPCEEAFEVQYFEKHTSREPLTHLLRDKRRWEKTGENHRTEIIKGEKFMVKDFFLITFGWAIRLPDLAALLEFTRTYEGCILHIKETGIAEIEIYDNYRE